MTLEEARASVVSARATLVGLDEAPNMVSAIGSLIRQNTLVSVGVALGAGALLGRGGLFRALVPLAVVLRSRVAQRVAAELFGALTAAPRAAGAVKGGSGAVT